jgi:hypothetical protein
MKKRFFLQECFSAAEATVLGSAIRPGYLFFPSFFPLFFFFTFPSSYLQEAAFVSGTRVRNRFFILLRFRTPFLLAQHIYR